MRAECAESGGEQRHHAAVNCDGLYAHLRVRGNRLFERAIMHIRIRGQNRARAEGGA